MIIDISRTLESTLAVWPGDRRFRLKQSLQIAEGASVNLTQLALSAHTGSHVDAPYHFAEDGATLEAIALEPFWGPTQVVRVGKADGPLMPEDFATYDLGQAPRLLVRSEASQVDPAVFPERFVYPSPELAAYLKIQGVILYGTDGPSMDAVDSKDLPGHHALLANGIAILEWLDLSQVEDGIYELAALPLKIAGGDGSPVRAALRPIRE